MVRRAALLMLTCLFLAAPTCELQLATFYFPVGHPGDAGRTLQVSLLQVSEVGAVTDELVLDTGVPQGSCLEYPVVFAPLLRAKYDDVDGYYYSFPAWPNLEGETDYSLEDCI
jgi:hypothetical protein